MNVQGMYAYPVDDEHREISAAAEAARAAVEHVRAIEDPGARAAAANALARELRTAADAATGILKTEVVRAYDAENLSFGKLADRFGISKTLAHRMVTSREKQPQD